MKVILVDDDKSMLLIMKKMISKIPDIEIVGSFQNPNKAYIYLLKNRVDMAFVDIKMPEENGLDFARRVSLEVKDIAIVFLTAHKEFALEAFGIHAFDYIVKPIMQNDLETSIRLAKERLVFLQPTKVQEASPKLSVNYLGSMEVRGENNERVHFTSTKSSELLGYLLMKKGRFVSKWSIIEDVFREMQPRNAETYLNTTIYKLRKTLEPLGFRSAIVFADESYMIDLKEIYVDFIDFENRLMIMKLNNYNHEEVLKTERIYHGELFGEKNYEWSLSEKERLSEAYSSFAKKMVAYLIEKNLMTVALQIANKLIIINEYDEETNCFLMKIYAAQRNRILLERQYQRYIQALERDLGIGPEKIVVNLYTVLIQSFKLGFERY